jgi:hypothetical protein
MNGKIPANENQEVWLIQKPMEVERRQVFFDNGNIKLSMI